MNIGTCSECGGAVAIPDLWGGVIPPTPTCTQCGAVAANHGPVMPMRPNPFRQQRDTYPPTIYGPVKTGPAVAANMCPHCFEHIGNPHAPWCPTKGAAAEIGKRSEGRVG